MAEQMPSNASDDSKVCCGVCGKMVNKITSLGKDEADEKLCSGCISKVTKTFPQLAMKLQCNEYLKMLDEEELNLAKKRKNLSRCRKLVSSTLLQYEEMKLGASMISFLKIYESSRKCVKEVRTAETFKASVQIKREDFKDVMSFMSEVVRLVRDSNLHSVLVMKEQIKYGKITLSEKNILFHALTLDDIPLGASTIWFEDIKHFASKMKNTVTFLDIKFENRVMPKSVFIQMRNSFLSPQFIKCCSGELGGSYKGGKCSFVYDQRGQPAVLEAFEGVCPAPAVPSEYACTNDGSDTNPILYYDQKVSVYGEKNGSFCIMRSNNQRNRFPQSSSSILGKVIKDEESLLSRGGEPTEITDCGLVYSDIAIKLRS